jgi:DNA polymerase-3 subunit epsilon
MDAFPEIFTIVDTETTGMRPASSSIMDIGIIRVEHGTVVDRFETLINPGSTVPYFIQNLTGISTEDVATSPPFEDVALKIEELFDGAVFVAHNASFDYRFLQSEFARIGKRFEAPKLCTVALSRKLFPKHKSHNLDALISRYSLSCETRHRAMPDAVVLEGFFQYLAATIPATELQQAVQHVLYGSHADKAGSFQKLPDSAGVYFFYGDDNDLLYIGKSKHVRTRARSHFSKNSEAREKHLQEGTTSIESISTSGELSALLLEAALIKKESPVYNRALRKRRILVVAHKKQNANGYLEVHYDHVEEILQDPDVLGIFKTTTQAKAKVRMLATEYTLCKKLCGLEKGSTTCFGYQLQSCDGACAGSISPEEYNQRLTEAFEKRALKIWPYKGTVAITESVNEDSGTVFFIHEWMLLGAFTYDTNGMFNTLLPADTSLDFDTYKILVRYMLNPANRRTIRVLSDTEFTTEFARCTNTYEVVV